MVSNTVVLITAVHVIVILYVFVWT